MWVRFATEEAVELGVDGHVCEVQLVLAGILDLLVRAMAWLAMVPWSVQGQRRAGQGESACKGREGFVTDFVCVEG